MGLTSGTSALAEVVDLARGGEAPELERELGSTFGMRDVLFADYADGSVFDYGPFEAQAMSDMLDRDGKAATLAQTLTLPIRSATWSIEPAPGDRGEADMVTEALTAPAYAGGMSTPMSLVIAQATSARIYRRACFEKVFKEHDGRIVYDKLAYRPPSTVDVARDPKTAAFRGFRQRPYMPMPTAGRGFEPVRIEAEYAFVHFANQSRDPIRGASDLQVALWCHETKKKLRFLWYQFLETQAGPRTVVTDRQGETSAGAAARKIAKLRNGGVAGVPEGTKVEVIESNGTGAQLFQAAMTYLDSEMSGSILAGFTDLTSAAASGRGSFALSTNATDFFLQASTAYASELASDLTNHVCADLVRYNFGQAAAYPAFRFAPLRETDLDPLMKILEMAKAEFPSEFLGEVAGKVAGFLDLDADEVRKAMKSAGQQAQQAARSPAAAPVADIAGQVSAAAQLVKGAA
ncbi:DUF935 family protein [Embleya sp. NPDC050154]|uniref:phage portal protein family protein n=1 Tax=Embleya sp. NPDC050154 TaxID=3363988 RepID=UPI00379F2CBB